MQRNWKGPSSSQALVIPKAVMNHHFSGQRNERKEEGQHALIKTFRRFPSFSPPPTLGVGLYFSCCLLERLGGGVRAGCLSSRPSGGLRSEAGPPAAGPCHSAGRPALARGSMKRAWGAPECSCSLAVCLSLCASSGDPPRAHTGCPAGDERGQGEGDAAALWGQCGGVWPPAVRPHLPAEGDRPG